MSLFAEFKKFAVRGNVVDLAIGVIIGASFTGCPTGVSCSGSTWQLPLHAATIP